MRCRCVHSAGDPAVWCRPFRLPRPQPFGEKQRLQPSGLVELYESMFALNLTSLHAAL